jgi:glycosyltransferase involved in cell wall biosynthesis
MKHVNKKILWIMPNDNEKSTGVYKYNLGLYKILKKKRLKIKIIKINNTKNYISKYIQKFIFLPWTLFKISRNYDQVVYPEEGFAFLIFFSISAKNILIVHDLRKIFNVDNKITLKEKIKQLYLDYNFLLINKFSKIIVPSKYTKNLLFKNYKKCSKKIIIFPNLVNKTISNGKISKNIKKIIRYKKKFKLILNVSSNETRKNHKALIKIASLNANFKLIIVSKLKIENKNIINFVNLKEVELSYLYKIVDVYLDLSLFEGFGRTLIEAQHFGLPVVCYKTKSNIEILKHAVLINQNSSFEDIIKKIKKIIITRNKKHKIISNALRFSSKKILKTHNKIIDEI